MAMTYQNFASLGVNLNRQKYGPLDISNVFTSENDLKYYLTKGTHTEGVSAYWYESADKKIVPYPYEGQVLATVIDGVVNVYALALDAEGNFITQEIAGKIEVDDKTVKANSEGKLELVGLESVEIGKTYVPSLVNGILTWSEPDTSTIEGQTQEINTLKTRTKALEDTVNGTDEADGLVKKVSDNAQTIAEEVAARQAGDSELTAKIAEALAEAKQYADDNDADTIYDDTQVKADIQANADAIDAVELALSNVYTKSEVFTKEEVNSAIAGITHFTTEIVESTEEMVSETVLYLVHDSTVTGADKYNEYLVIGGVPTMIGDTTTDLTQYATKAELEEHAKDAESTYATKEALAANDSAAAAKYATKEELSQYTTEAESKYALKTDVETALGEKADATDLEAYYTKTEIDDKGYAVATEVESNLTETLKNYYTKSEAMAKTEAYTKAEVDELIDDVSGGSSETVASVKRVLDEYIQNMDTEVYGAEVVESWTDSEGHYNPQYTVNDSRIDTALANAATAQAQANKGVQDAAAANSAITELSSKVATNKNDIDAVTGRLTSLETAKGEQATQIATINGKITGLEAADEVINSTIGTITSDIVALKAKDTTLDSNIAAVQTALTDKADKTTVETLAGNVYTKTEVNDLLQNLDLSSVNAAIAANTKAIADEKTRAETAETELANNISAIIGDDSGKTIRAIAKEEVALVVDSAPEAFDTLKEIAIWIQDDQTGAAAMAEQIAAHSTILAGFGGEGQPTDIKSFVESSIAASRYDLPVATLEALGGIKSAADTLDNAIQVSAEGIATVARVNVNTLVQTEGDMLILYGGRA